MAHLEIKDLSFTYNGTPSPALQSKDLTVESGDFILLCGESGCGKTTLLRLLKQQLRPAGTLTGSISYLGRPLDALSEREKVSEIGYVMQNPENATVTDKVWHELAFGLESLGEESGAIRRRVAEISSFFGIGSLYRKKTSELSGGQKQLLALASVMVTDPKLLLLDEPTAQLDPIAAAEFLSALRRINEELGVTVIIAEHRLEEVFPMASKVALMDKARIHLADAPAALAARLSGEEAHRMALGFPTAVRLFHALGGKGACPLTVREGKRFIAEHYRGEITSLAHTPPDLTVREKAIELAGAFFRYERETPDVLSDLDLTVYAGELLAILGDNGAGKTTLLRVLSGTRRLYKGKYRLWGKKRSEYGASGLYRGNLAALPQNPQSLFVGSSVREDLGEVTRLLALPKTESDARISEIAEKLGISHLLDKHPYDLSGGEQQKAAIAKLLLLEPRILLLDEPTKGLDAHAKRGLAEILRGLTAEGRTVVLVTHDVEFAASCADRCALFFDGKIVSAADPVTFFSTNRHYTTAAARITRPTYRNAVTLDSAVELCTLNGRKQSAAESDVNND